MKALIIIIIGLSSSLYSVDLESDSVLQSIFAPIGIAVFLIALMLWLVLKAGFGKKMGRGGLGDTWFGGDGGGGDGC